MSALAMFSLKSPSLLAFDNGRAEPIVQKNLQTLFKIDHAPSDTYMREVLDEVDPKDIRDSFLNIFYEAQRGKLLERYRFLSGYLCLVDRTEIFNSEKVHCGSCCKKEHKDGRITYHHQILGAVITHPNLHQVIPFCPEPITKQDGETKNDCERNAFRRFLEDLKKEHPQLSLTMVSDALLANAPHVNTVKSYGHHFIIVAKSEGNKKLYESVKGITEETVVIVGRKKYKFRYVNDVELNDTKNGPKVNFFDCEWVEIDGKKEKRGYCGWITDHKITKDNIYELMLGGRARWKVENETFNTLKNQGYQFEHNFGHGKKNLHAIFALLMMLAFLIDQIQEAACGLFQAALIGMKSRRALWERMRGFFQMYLIKSWSDLFIVMSQRLTFKGVELPLDTC
ncbi:MAG: transposase [Verrucomicrobia bacterium]|nr:transposase [Verrucomicrobiota bacterium]